MPPNFDRLARLYYPLELVTLGSLLRRTREHFLPALRHSRHALVLGDGDGRFLAQLLAGNANLEAHAVDLSAAMLRQLHRRCLRAAPDAAARLTLHHTDALSFVRQPPRDRLAPDLVVTHFLLDCLSHAEVAELVDRTAARMPTGGLWVVSEFRIPPAGPMRAVARLLVRSLYLAFRVLTGLRVMHLPEYALAFHEAGLRCRSSHTRLGGALVSELWQKT